MKKFYTILVTGVGSIIGYGIIDGLKKSTIPVKVVGIDIFADAWGGSLADEFVQGVRADDPGFIHFINGLTEKHEIDLIIPGIEQDLYTLWENRTQLKAKIVFGNETCMELARNKFATYSYLKEKGLPHIATLQHTDFANCSKTLGLPFLLKPVLSSASKGIERINTEEEFNFFTKRNNGNCIYQRIVGSIEDEYTASVFGDGSGNVADLIMLKRKLSGEGATSKAIYVTDEAVKQYILSLCRELKPLGPLNLQIRKENGQPVLLEINSRVSSSCSIRTKMGYNEPEMCVRYFLLNEWPAPATHIPGRAIRYIADQFFPG